MNVSLRITSQVEKDSICVGMFSWFRYLPSGSVNRRHGLLKQVMVKMSLNQHIRTHFVVGGLLEIVGLTAVVLCYVLVSVYHMIIIHTHCKVLKS